MKKSFNKTFNYILATGFLVAILVWSFALNIIYADEKTGAKLVFFDIGQGDSALISLPNSIQILVDTGKKKEVLEKIEKNMPLYDRRIEYLVLSHADSDHVGMANDIMESFTVGQVVVGPSVSDSQTYQEIEETIAENKISRKQVGAGDKICALENACMDFVSPEIGASGKDTNEQSLVFRFDYNGARVIFTGDAEKDVQKQIVSKYPSDELESSILKVAHHGSREAINNEFLDRVSPATAIVSVGKNSYGHPVKETLETIKNKNIQILRTDEEGDIEFGFESGKLVRSF